MLENSACREQFACLFAASIFHSLKYTLCFSNHRLTRLPISTSFPTELSKRISIVPARNVSELVHASNMYSTKVVSAQCLWLKISIRNSPRLSRSIQSQFRQPIELHINELVCVFLHRNELDYAFFRFGLHISIQIDFHSAYWQQCPLHISQ